MSATHINVTVDFNFINKSLDMRIPTEQTTTELIDNLLEVCGVSKPNKPLCIYVKNKHKILLGHQTPKEEKITNGDILQIF